MNSVAVLSHLCTVAVRRYNLALIFRVKRLVKGH
jgi:hypothetical protein